MDCKIVSHKTQGQVPLIYILEHEKKFAILYTPTMTFLDGFDPASRHPKNPLIPSSLIQKARFSMYSSSPINSKY